LASAAVSSAPGSLRSVTVDAVQVAFRCADDDAEEVRSFATVSVETL
jgi:hypothetical protein